MPQHLSIYTIGHSNHETPKLIDLLRQHGITLVVDVRSQPYSQWAHQFNREVIVQDLEEARIAYQFMGRALGGRPSDPALYNGGQNHPSYERVEQTSTYQSGIDRLLELARAERVAVMCSEGDHAHCHRNLLITQTLLARDVRVIHIRPDGATIEGKPIAQQLSLF